MMRSAPKAEKDRSERWLLTYADLITLLMVFFVILFSFSIIDVKRFLDLKGSLDKAFSAGVLSGINTVSLNSAVSYGTVDQQIQSEADNAKVSVASQLQKVADATGAGDQITILQVRQGVTVSVTAAVLFQSGTAQLKPGAAQILAQLSEPLKQLSNPIQIISNTDELPPEPTNSTYKDNWALGDARSYTVLQTLINQDSFPQERLSLWNKAQYSPMFPNDTPENRAKNRRVDFLIVFPTSDAAAQTNAPGAPATTQTNAPR